MKAKIENLYGVLPGCITLEKEYDVISYDGKGFDFLDDDGEWNYTNVNGSWILNGGDWELIKCT